MTLWCATDITIKHHAPRTRGHVSPFHFCVTRALETSGKPTVESSDGVGLARSWRVTPHPRDSSSPNFQLQAVALQNGLAKLLTVPIEEPAK